MNIAMSKMSATCGIRKNKDQAFYKFTTTQIEIQIQIQVYIQIWVWILRIFETLGSTYGKETTNKKIITILSYFFRSSESKPFKNHNNKTTSYIQKREFVCIFLAIHVRYNIFLSHILISISPMNTLFYLRLFQD